IRNTNNQRRSKFQPLTSGHSTETERRTEISQTNISYFQLPSVRKTIYLTPLGVNAKDLFSTLDRILNAGPGKTQQGLKLEITAQFEASRHEGALILRLSFQITIHPLSHGLIPNLAVLGFQDPVAFIREIEHL